MSAAYDNLPSNYDPNLEDALRIAALGWTVHPLYTPKSNGHCDCGKNCEKSNGKHPRINEWEKKSTTNERQIRTWGALYPRSNWGVGAGARSGIFILDCDGPEGAAVVAEHGDIPRTPTVKTGKGRQYYFKHPGWDVGNYVKRLPGLDIRGEDGNAVLPPSMHYNGTRYAWEIAPWDCELSEAPQWVLDITKEIEYTRTTVEGTRKLANGTTSYGQAVLDGVCDEIRTAGEGTRNNTLNKGAYRVFRFVEGGEIQEDDAWRELEAASPLPKHETEITLKSARSGARNAQPLSAPEPKERKLKIVRFNELVADDGTQETADPETKYHLSDTGNLERFIKLHGDTIRYVLGWDWVYWNGSHWCFDETGVIAEKARETVKSIYGEAKACENVDERKAIAKWAMHCESRKMMNAFIGLAQDAVWGGTTKADYDADPMLFNANNGTIDLRTGELYPHDPINLITKISPVDYNPDAECPVWVDFLFTIMGGRTGDEGAVDRAWRMVDFLQRAIGATLSGLLMEEIVLLCVGVGGNGKSKMVETILTMMGSYGKTASFDTFLESRLAGGGGGAQENILKLMGARFVKASEPDAGKRLSTSVLKDLTGNETVTARGLYEKRSMEFRPQFTLWLSANHKPEVSGQDNGIWRRIKLIPFDMVFVDAADLETARAASARPKHIMPKDPALGEKLLAELPGILTWAVQGCIAWQAGGLQPPKEVEIATKEYKAENDVLGDFFTERCIRGKGQKTVYGELYRAYIAYCEDEGQKAIKKKTFRSALEERGLFVAVGADNKMFAHGIGLVNDN